MHLKRDLAKFPSLLLFTLLLLPTIAYSVDEQPLVPFNKDKDKDQAHEEVTAETTECEPDMETLEWVDHYRKTAHNSLCNVARWFDGLFGDDREFDDDNFRGKVVVGYEHDEIDGFDPKLRIRLKTKLPNVSNRLNAFIGRVEEDEFIAESESNQDSITAVGLRSNDEDEAEWLIGLGYRNPKKRDSGFDYSIGAKISSGLNPYAKIRHNHLFTLNEPHYLRATQTVFWRNDDGYGFSSGLNYTYVAGIKDIIELAGLAKFTQDDEQWEWITGTTWHHSFSRKRGISSRVYVRGEEENPVSVPEYGTTFTYRQPFLRDWFFIELGVDFRWEKELPEDDYESAIRYGIQAEMLLGDYYKRNRKR